MGGYGAVVVLESSLSVYFVKVKIIRWAEGVVSLLVSEQYISHTLYITLH